MARERFAFTRTPPRPLLITSFRDPDEPESVATVPARAVANGRWADFVMTIVQPPELDDEAFDRELAVIATEFATLKEVLERP